MTSFAKFISNVFNPLLVPFLSAAYVLFGGIVFSVDELPFVARRFLLIVIFVFTFLLPLLTIVGLKAFGFAEGLHLPKRRQRFVPFLFSILYYGAAYTFLASIQGLPAFLLHLMLTGILLLAVALLFTLWYQISIHTLCMGSLVGLLCHVAWFYAAPVFPALLGALVLSGLVAFSRLLLNAHKPYQVYSGFLVGLAVQYFGLLALLIFSVR